MFDTKSSPLAYFKPFLSKKYNPAAQKRRANNTYKPDCQAYKNQTTVTDIKG